jgi:hypothetical protein
MSHRRFAAMLALVTLVATACFRVDLKVSVEDDGSGRVEGLIALDVEAAAEIAAVFDSEDAPIPDRAELCEEFLTDTDVPDDAQVEPYEDGDLCGITYSVDFTPDQMDEVLAGASDDSGDFSIERDGDGWRFDATLSDEAGADAEFFPAELLGNPEFTVRIKLPGRQVEHNADRIESDGTMVWELDLFNPGDPLMARTEPGPPITGSGDGGSNTVLIVVLVIVALAAVGGFLWWRNRSAEPPEPAPPAEAPPPPA